MKVNFKISMLLRYKSQLYSMLAWLFPLSMLLAYQAVPLWLPLAYAVIVIVLSRHFSAYVKGMLAIEDRINLKLGLVTPARICRVPLHVPVVGILYGAMVVLSQSSFSAQACLLYIAGSTGIQSWAITAAYRGWGDRVSNSLLAFLLVSGSMSASVLYPGAWSLVYLGVAALCLHLALGALSDMRTWLHPKKGVGVFFGTFNPVHKTHIKILQEAISDRGLSKVYLHPTTVPKLHRLALSHGEIAMTEEEGMRVYHKTELADKNKNYFPTGRKFYPYEVRHQLLRAGVSDAGLEEIVEVLDWPDVYDSRGFFGVIAEIRRSLPAGTPIHGIHGSDLGGIWVRNIFEIAGGIYPYPVIRSDCISATAIREGAVGYTTPTIEAFLAASRAGTDFIFPTGYVFKNNSRNHWR
ncbi:hypothetical protein FNL37_0269 [Methylovorus glucosotrophus]|uniref:hypothetical protein n=1 Tax=Methylovorus glucosotrophus TaxID=266009 RepID=UPI001331AA21|nr:hypothetical protein [Methylovorus glucosotrophus]KAF0842856.1 hypothetical protein FNL37_0269 [Methylovorus glucosotrophus]